MKVHPSVKNTNYISGLCYSNDGILPIHIYAGFAYKEIEENRYICIV